MKALLWSLLSVVIMSACTPGGMGSATGGGGGGSVMTVDVNLTLHTDGYLPDTLTVPVGSAIRFFNSDGFAHTATLIPGANTFPVQRPWDASVLSPSGTQLSQAWTSGTLQAGASSQIITVDVPGTYLYGCFYHYGAPMRGTIVAQ